MSDVQQAVPSLTHRGLRLSEHAAALVCYLTSGLSREAANAACPHEYLETFPGALLSAE